MTIARHLQQSGAFTPPAGLTYWFRADTLGLSDGTAVTTWPDSSGNGKNATQPTSTKRPLYRASGISGLPAVDFDGTDDYLEIAAYAQGNTGIYIAVVQVADALDSADRVIVMHGGGAAWTSPFARYMMRHKTTESQVWVQNGGTTTDYVQVVRTNTAGVASLDEFSYDGTTIESRRGGTVSGTKSYSSGYTSTSDVTRLGSNNTVGGAETWNGKIAELLCWESTVSSTDRASVRAYLAAKYGL